MDCYFVSDDSYCLLGFDIMSEWYAIDGEHFYINPLNVGDIGSCFRPKPGDIVVLAVSSQTLRRTVMLLPKLRVCRLIIMAKLNIQTQLDTGNPWLVPLRIPNKTFSRLFHRVARSQIIWKDDGIKANTIFMGLGYEYNVSGIAELLRVPKKSIYEIRRRVLGRNGLSGCNVAAGISLYRDVIEMKRKYL